MMGWPSPDMDIHVGLRSCIIKKKKDGFEILGQTGVPPVTYADLAGAEKRRERWV